MAVETVECSENPPCVCLSVYACVCVCLSVCPSVCLSVRVFMCVCVCVCVCACVCLSVRVSVCASFHLCVRARVKLEKERETDARNTGQCKTWRISDGIVASGTMALLAIHVTYVIMRYMRYVRASGTMAPAMRPIHVTYIIMRYMRYTRYAPYPRLSSWIHDILHTLPCFK